VAMISTARLMQEAYARGSVRSQPSNRVGSSR
jgi:hypothetical protein